MTKEEKEKEKGHEWRSRVYKEKMGFLHMKTEFKNVYIAFIT